MIDWLRANFDLTDILSFNYNIQSGQLTVHGKDELGRLSVKNKNLSRLEAAILFRLHVNTLAGMP